MPDTASPEPEFERVCRTLGALGERRMPFQTHPVRRSFATTRLDRVHRPFSFRTKSSRQGQSTPLPARLSNTNCVSRKRPLPTNALAAYFDTTRGGLIIHRTGCGAPLGESVRPAAHHRAPPWRPPPFARMSGATARMHRNALCSDTWCITNHRSTEIVCTGRTPAQGFVRYFRDLGPAHHYGNPSGPQRIRHAVRFGDHAGMAPIPTNSIFSSSANRTSSGSLMGCVLPSIETTS